MMNYREILPAAAVLAGGLFAVGGQTSPASALFTTAQAEAGEHVRPLVGDEFVGRFGTKTAVIARFQETVDAFPPDRINDETTVNITAYVLQANRAKPGSWPLTRTIGVVVGSVMP